MISVCLISYNGELFIKEQVESILSQIEDYDELIISDDSSTDNTVQILESIDDVRIKLFRDGLYHSPIRNIEFAISKAKGDFIFLSDQDDVWLPDKIEVMLKYLKYYSLVISDAFVCDSELNIISTFANQRYIRTRYNRLRNNPFLGCCMAFHKDMINYILPFPKKTAMHDIWIGWVIDLISNIIFIDEKLIYFRRHESNNSTTISKSNNSLLKKIIIRFQLIKNLFFRIIRIKYGRYFSNNSNI